MRDEYKKLARNYFLLGLWGEKKGMTTEPVANYFKALFAITDGILYDKIGRDAKDHSDRFRQLQRHDPQIYAIVDTLWITYQSTYRALMSRTEVEHVRKKVEEVFKRERINIPTEKDL